MPKFYSNNQAWTNSDTIWKDIVKPDLIFYQKTLRYFNDLQIQNFSIFWLNWTQTMEMKHFSMGHIQIWQHIFFLLKNIKVFQWLLKWKLLSFMTKVNLNNGNETKSDIFLWDIFKSDIILHGRNILKYLNDFYHWPFSISLQKWARTIKVK